jgi:site-specific recombinase
LNPSNLQKPQAVSPDLDTFAKALLPEAPAHRALRTLHALFSELDPDAELSQREEQLEHFARWLRKSGRLPAFDDSQPGERPEVARLRLLVRSFERLPDLAMRFGAVLGSVLGECSGLRLLSRAGIPADRGLFGETMDRLSRSILPQPVDERDLGQLVARFFPVPRDVVWLTSVPASLVLRFVTSLADRGPGGQKLWSEIERAAADSLALIAQRVAGVGLYDAIRVRSPVVPVRGSPFFLLPRATDTLLEALFSLDPSAVPVAEGDCRALVAACRETVASVTHNLEHTGVSVDVVYRLELISKNLERYEALLERLTQSAPIDRAEGVKQLLVRLIEARRNERALGQILTTNVHLLARKIIERAGHTGEHYITTSRREYFKMLASAGGGGVLTTGTAATKYLIGWAHFAPFVEGVLSAVNYAGSFLVMQLLGFTLATKQPSMTAAALASSMQTSAAQKDLSGLVTMIARITRSQLAAALGNLGLVIPTAYVFDFFWRRRFGAPFLDEKTADYVLLSLHPTQSGTIFFAALTGVLLWLSSVGAGWLENWATYRRLPEAIAEHRIRKLIGRRATTWASRVFMRNISGFGGNVTLGTLLGMTPIAGKFFGLPLDVRHVTLSTGALTFAVCSRGLGSLSSPEVRAAAVGILIIGALNFGVSFVLALSVALRAREVAYRDRLRMWASVFITLFRSPLQFVLPPKAPQAVPVHGPVSVRPPPVH